MRDFHFVRLLGSGTRGGSSLGLVVLCATILTLGAVFHVWQRHQFLRLGFTVSELRQQRRALESAIEPLELEVDYLSRLERIDRLAREKLGMRPPLPSQVRLADTP